MTRNRFISGVVILTFLAVVLIVATQPKREHGPAALTAIDTVPVETVEQPAQQPAPPPEPSPAYAGIVRKNTSFFDLLTACGVTPQEINTIAKKSKAVYDFRRIYPGQSYSLYTDSVGCFDRFTLELDDVSYIEVNRDGGDFSTERKEYPFEVEVKSASGLIQHSLYATIIDQSLPLELGAKLADIFAWDIDFFTDVRKNDYFRVIYEEKRRNDLPEDERGAAIGDIIAAEFNTRGVSHYAFLFENETDLPDYFDLNGKSLRKQLLKAPLSYTRISSRFSRRRYHPVLHHYAPHYGIDYAAPTGTPVMTTGDGTVMVAGYRRGNGNYVKIRHNSSYITYYLHLSRFAKGIKAGIKVKQGQVIGYVGATGYATGPHLDYRVKKYGRFVNPRSIKLPPAKPVSEHNMAQFHTLRDSLIADMQLIPIADWRTEHFAGRGPLPTDPNPMKTDEHNAHQSAAH